ncbi:tripartite-type tricarboxylate transporter receptor subunit TctC [Alkalihalobacillus xiaoxiensis]|uniref:Tripartite-type tricarboxylate transporter receptor subunit TctC n=1 Tax=Shouchella xiaoxiensis TaxID=766895 RepID=A0ABS2SZN2_9BACI|nr:tripartite tricarboxylate transporter substrate binding protein [Shouchella xiaoxiensis]MBM7840944.1 tripartite-type tricarboxylate transporter receptor subunit TctC [Shouchella xiaoxiensis]
MKKGFVLSISLTCVAAILAGCNSEAATYPSKEIKIIVPNAPGGGTDIVARGLVDHAKDQLNTTVVVENNTEGGGITGLIQGASADADGYTLTMTTVELAMLPHLDRLPVTHEDFIPIVAPIADPASVIVPSDAPYDTVQEFIEYAKANPGEIQVGNSGIGAVWHLAAIALEDEFDIDLSHIPYDGGTAPAIAALTGGHIDAVTAAPGNAMAQINAGDLKVLGVMSEERLEFLPDVPTLKEELNFDISIRAWAALSVPADTPEEVLEELNVFVETAKDPEFQTFLSNQGIIPVSFNGDELAEMMANDHEMYSELMKNLDL